MKTFSDLGLSNETLEVLKQKGFEVPTPVQEKAIPAILNGDKDIVAQAQTGTGKTAAFGLPILEQIERNPKHIQVLVLTPTRELAIQVVEEINSLKGKKNLVAIPIYGGQSMDLQLKRLRSGVDIVVGTPGRILDHLKRKTLKLDQVSYFVLDEADEMLNMGFLEDVSEIMKKTPQEKRTFLFSATMPIEITRVAKNYMREYEHIKVTTGQLTVSQTNQLYFEVAEGDKFEALCRIIDVEENFYGLVFCKTKVDVDKVASRLMERGYDAEALHGDMSQGHREKMLGKFRKEVINILVATDVAARGIDVQNLTHVINYALPHDPESYVHRIGRTGRAGKEGNAVTFVTPSEYRKLQFIKYKTKTEIQKGKLPSVQAVIKIKKERIKAQLNEMAKSPLNSEALNMAREILSQHEPEAVLAALLQKSFQDTLNGKNYAEIEETNIDKKGTTRLFVRGGKQDKLTKEKLASLIAERCKIDPEKIKGIEILERFSFVTLPFKEAEIVLEEFRDHENGKPFMTQAKKKSGKRNSHEFRR